MLHYSLLHLHFIVNTPPCAETNKALCKSSTLAFVLLFAFFFRLEKPELKLILVIATITIGVILMVATETEFVLTGYILVPTN